MTVFVLLCLAVYRVFRLIARDDITSPLRKPLHLGDGRVRAWLRSGAECPWCLGSWLSVGATYVTHRYVYAMHPHWLLWAVAVACVVGFLGELDGRLSE